MRKYISYLSILTMIIVFIACKKKTDGVTENNLVKPHYPTIKLNGNQFVSTPIGTGAYTDPGAVGTNDQTGAKVNLTPIKNTVDLTTPGFYTVTYEFRNDDGYIVDVTRFVLVTTVSSSKDFSGKYERTNSDSAFVRVANVSKIGIGLYRIDNVGGVKTTTQLPTEPAYIGFPNDSTIQIPLQTTPDGTSLSAADGIFYIDNSVIPSDTIMQWRMTAGPFSFSSIRQFTKVH